MKLFPAVDIKNGVTLNLTDPGQLINKYVQAGIELIHLVDLDRAYGSGNNDKLISELIAEYQIDFQLSGGISDELSLSNAIMKTPTRINLSADSIKDQTFLKNAFTRYNEKLAISLDVKDEQLIPRGSQSSLGDYQPILKDLIDLGAKRFVVTDVDTDGKLTGPNFELLEQVAAICFNRNKEIEIIASGGVNSYGELKQLKSLQIAGKAAISAVIVGRALIDGLLEVEKSLQSIAE
jgi:phosphoribosylformimino-5-aminoimidazole carboxamide ribonucleotide (ProFAR) isomerase